MSYHSITLAGQVGADPETRMTPNGGKVVSFPVSSRRTYKTRAGEERDEVIWFSVSVWGRTAEFCEEHLRRDMTVFVEGRLQADETGNPRIWQAKDGTHKSSFAVTAQQVVLGKGEIE